MKCNSFENGAGFDLEGHITGGGGESANGDFWWEYKKVAETCDTGDDSATSAEFLGAYIPKVGDNIDVKDTDSNSWVAGKVLSFSEVSPGTYKYICSKDDFPGTVSLIWPDPNLATKCGLMIPDKMHCKSENADNDLI